MSSPDEAAGATSFKTEGDNARVTVKISLKQKFGKADLKSKYKVEKYNLMEGYTAGPTLQALVPKGTPEYVEHGENYVERIMRALYHFKQCALIGPSGTGKSICEGEQVFVQLDGRPKLTTVDSIFETLSRRYPTTVDQDGWEVLRLADVNLSVLSLDPVRSLAVWKRAYALGRSRYKGDVVEVVTRRNRAIRATPDHSFITDSEVVRGGKVAIGSLIPIIRHVPNTTGAPLNSIEVAGFVPGAKSIQTGIVVAGIGESKQIPAPPLISLDPEFAWFMGFFVAEGSIARDHASVTNSNPYLIWRCSKALSKLDLVPWTRKSRGVTELRVSSKAFVAMLSAVTLTRRVGSGKGSQARYKRVPDFVFEMDDKCKVAFLRGFFEGDGWVEQGSSLLLGTSSKELANGLITLLEQLGVFPTLVVKSRTKSYVITVSREDAARFTGELTHGPGKQDARGHVEKVKVTPAMLAAAKRAYKKLPSRVRTKEFHKKTVSYFYTRTRMIGLNTLKKIAKDLQSPELMEAADNNLLWDPVKEVTRIPYDGWVYDFQVPGTESFAAGLGGVITHNTHVVYLVSELAGLPLWEINCGLQTSVYDLFGRFVGLGKENWIDGQIVSWCRYGGILYLDEANMMKQDIATRLNPILDTRGHMVLNERDNEVIPRHPNGYVIISMNPYSSEFAGTKPLNAAFRRRMSVWIDFDYLSVGNKIAEDEVEMISKRAKVGLPVAEKLVRVAAEIRRQYKTGDLPYAPSVGDLINWAILVADGLTPAQAAEETIIALTADDPEVQNNVRRVVKMVVGESEASTK